jgi:hypothetical protein
MGEEGRSGSRRGYVLGSRGLAAYTRFEYFIIVVYCPGTASGCVDPVGEARTPSKLAVYGILR